MFFFSFKIFFSNFCDSVLSCELFMLSCFCHVQLFVILWTGAHQGPLSVDSPGKNTGVGCHALFHGIFLTQGSLAGEFFTTSATWELEVLYLAYKYLRSFSIFSFVVEDILLIVSVLSHYLTSETMVYPSKCSSRTWKECVFFYCWVECSINAN